MINWKDIVVAPTATLREAIAAIDRGACQIALVTTPQYQLLGILTDGDVRRGILRGCSLDSEVAGLMNTSPLCVAPEDDRQLVLAMMRSRRINHIPVVDSNRVVIGIETIHALLSPQRRDNIVVLMAGGLGSRLRPLTDDCPKPLLPVGNRPILETILSSFIEFGFHRFYISVNYMSDKIKAYFGDGSRWGVEIAYLEENQRLGTAGALSLLPETPQLPLFVMNGDILAKLNFEAMLAFHLQHQSTATLAMRQFSHTIPYGVVTVDEHKLVDIVEKPENKVFVSAGIYLLSPEVLTMIPPGEFYDMPMLFQQLIRQGLPTSGFPVHEYWIDIGRIEDFERACEEYVGVFA
ncbi:nucleotidyltransferase family protein [Vogesella amnigena]|uniref:Nucleotidyltransferase family protein n=1 Tax=Vogesella amnigena TaxID=1507449 RepID=A0ABV7TS62_9NEIS